MQACAVHLRDRTPKRCRVASGRIALISFGGSVAMPVGYLLSLEELYRRTSAGSGYSKVLPS
jgi:hypothetical protein